jgi:hypothetical protein
LNIGSMLISISGNQRPGWTALIGVRRAEKRDGER